MAIPPIRLLLVDDDEESHLLVRHLLTRIEGDSQYTLDWEPRFDKALELIGAQRHALYLIDYRLEDRTGLELLRLAHERGCRAPMVLLTGLGDRATDLEAMRAGAVDYLCKDELTSPLLERTIRYALEHHRLLEERDHQALKLRLLAAELGSAEERERRRIAMLIHDELQQTIVATKMHLGNLQRQLDGERAGDTQRLQGLLDDALTTCRDLATGVSPPVLHGAGLLAACRWLAGWMQQHYELDVDVQLDEHAEPADEHVRTFLYHAVRELLFNVVKHAHTRQARLRATRIAGQQITRIDVEDDGCGFDPEHVAQDARNLTHFGLFSIRQRLELMSGHMQIDAAPNRGTRISLFVPSEATTRLFVTAPHAPAPERRTA